MKKYILSQVILANNAIVPIKVYDDYKSFQQGLINHFKEKIESCPEHTSGLANGQTLSFSFKVNIADSE